MTQDEIDNIKYGEPMTTHDRDKIIAAAKEAGVFEYIDFDGSRFLAMPESCWDKFYAIAFEDGRKDEREDAERYRFLRDNSAYVGVNPHSKTCLWVLRGIREIDGAGFDEAVDGAIRARGDRNE